DFTRIDPHLGSNEDLRALVDAAHTRGMKVYFDIITNHTAAVIGYAEGARQPDAPKGVEPSPHPPPRLRRAGGGPPPAVRVQGRRALPPRRGPALRRPGLCRHVDLPAAE